MMADEHKSFAQMQLDERRRVADLLKRDKAEQVRERDRRLAELEVAKGNFINLSDMVIEPTPEWLSKTPIQPYTPRQPDGTVRVIKTVRRVITPVVAKMHARGNLSDDHLIACLWYRDRHDAAGLTGRFKSSHISLTGNVGGGGGGSGQAPMALHQLEAEARNEYRAARAALTAFYVRFFEAVVINDVPLSRASKFARCRNEKAPHRFRDCCNELIGFISKNKISIGGANDDG